MSDRTDRIWLDLAKRGERLRDAQERQKQEIAADRSARDREAEEAAAEFWRRVEANAAAGIAHDAEAMERDRERILEWKRRKRKEVV